MPRRSHRKKDKDPDCKAIYAWENSWPGWDGETLSLEQTRKVVRLACTAYNMDAPVVRQHKAAVRHSITHTPPHGSFISFNPRHKNVSSALHEAAHHISIRLFGSLIQCHGPEWRGVYFFLLARSEIAPLSALKASLRPFGLRWIEIKPYALG